MEHSCLPAQEPRHSAQQPGLPAVLQSFHNVTHSHSEGQGAMKCSSVHETIIIQEVQSWRSFARGGGGGGNAQNTKGINSSNAEIIIVIYNIRYAFICISVGAISAMCSSHICELKNTFIVISLMKNSKKQGTCVSLFAV